jgi:colanic acid biosynthesis glycosyl transferase WcaI
LKRKDILFIGINFFPEPTGIGKYSGEMVEWLSKQGKEIEVITGFPYYPYWKLDKKYNWYKKEEVFGSKVKVHRCPLYVPQRPTGLNRIYQELSFFAFALPKVIYLSIKLKPKFIVCIAPPFHLGLLGYISKVLSGGKLFYHIQDLQIEAAKSLNMIKQEWLIRSLLRVEKFILSKSNFISSIHPNMICEIKSKTTLEVGLLPNWTNLQLLYPIAEKTKLREMYGFPLNKKIFLYSGSVGEKQGIELVFNFAKNFNNDDSILFIVAGNGPYHNQLKETIQKEGIKNIIARNLVPTSELNTWLNLADYHLIFQRNETSNYLFPSKLVSILSVGGICIAFVPETNKMGKMLIDNEIGYVISEVDPIIIYQKLTKIIATDGSRIQINSREFAISNFNKEKILENWVNQTLLT